MCWYCKCSRWVIMPMKIYNGPGVTTNDLLEDTNACLASIASTLNRCCPNRSCCGRG